jgi:hypothetical protein
MKCPVIDYHKNRSKKWWLKYIGILILAFVTGGSLDFKQIDKWDKPDDKIGAMSGENK